MVEMRVARPYATPYVFKVKSIFDWSFPSKTEKSNLGTFFSITLVARLISCVLSDGFIAEQMVYWRLIRGAFGL